MQLAGILGSMILFVVIAIALFVSAGISIRAVIRTPQDPQGREPRSLRVARGLIRSATLSLFGFAIVCLGIPKIPLGAYSIAILAAMTLTIILLLINFLRRQAYNIEKPQRTTRGLLRELRKLFLRRLGVMFKNAFRTIAPNSKSWQELRFPLNPLDRLLSFKFLATGYVILVAVVSIYLMIWFAISLGSTPGAQGAVVKAVVGYNSLFVVAILTITSLCVVAIVLVLKYIDVVHFSIEVSVALKSLAVYVGYGTLAGVIAAALSPGTDAVLDQPSNDLSGPLVPGILIELPAYGAILGYVFGLILVISKLGQESTNLIYRHFFTPLLFVASLVFVYRMGLTPEFLFDQVVMEDFDRARIPIDACSMSTNDERVHDNISDPTWALALGEQCEGKPVIPGENLVNYASWCVMILAAIRFIKSLWMGTRKNSSGASSSTT
ncbi:hypothetical protein [Rothia halotolerans]|uniref:hypothetical protein n=1 Tax=Rothia halotolerans TaxID=405770 RepID=UPI00101C11DF|nr:hypothetical protein [Rothia halotolerans]